MNRAPTSAESAYAAAALAFPRAFQEIESLLEGLQRGVTIAAGELQRLTKSSVGYEQIILAMRSLADIGVVRPCGDASWALEQEGLTRTAEFRLGIRAAHAASKRPSVNTRILAALPNSIDERTRVEIRLHATDLTAAVIDLIAAAKRSLILASPFWDDEAVQKLEPILRRRLAEGVDVILLARTVAADDEAGTALAALAQRLHKMTGLRLMTWFEPDPSDKWGSRTFHFKAGVADEGTRAYLGSANFTTGGLQSRLELGVILSGPPAASLYHVLRAVVQSAR